MPYQINCKICSSEFKARVPHASYCSKECRKEGAKSSSLKSRKKMKQIRGLGKECKACQKVFKTLREDAKFCSSACFGESIMSTTTKNCPQCKETFSGPAYEPKKKKFCSKDCSDESLRGDSHPPVKKICPNCNKNFEVRWRFRNKRTFCSKSCASSGEFNGMFGWKPTEEQRRRMSENNWMRGKSVKTHPKVAALGRKISKTLKKKHEVWTQDKVGDLL